MMDYVYAVASFSTFVWDSVYGFLVPYGNYEHIMVVSVVTGMTWNVECELNQTIEWIILRDNYPSANHDFYKDGEWTHCFYHYGWGTNLSMYWRWGDPRRFLGTLPYPYKPIYWYETMETRFTTPYFVAEIYPHAGWNLTDIVRPRRYFGW
jgi:hypothetical protein